VDAVELFLVLVGVVDGREGRGDLFAPQPFPVDVAEPGVRHHFLGAVVAEPVLRLALDELVHEVHGFLRPVGRDVLLLDLRLLG
jgi:hypothetical protein